MEDFKTTAVIVEQIEEELVAKEINPQELEGWSLKPWSNLALFILNMMLKDDKYRINNSTGPFYWVNGRVNWSLHDLNIVIQHMGVANFLNSLGDNSGGAKYKYAIDMLNAYRDFTKGEISNCSYIVDEVLDWMKENIKNFHFYSHPPFREAGENWSEHFVCENGIFTQYWVDNNEEN